MELYLDLPIAITKKLSFCKTNPQALKLWASKLPLADPNKTAQSLYLALGEIAELEMKPAAKFQLLAVLDEAIEPCLFGLRKHFLNQPLVLPPQAFTRANLALALIKRHQSIYYWILESSLTAMSRKFAKPSKLFSQALEAFFKDSNRIFIHQSLLYRPCEPSFWLLNHQFYAHALNLGILKDKSQPSNNGIQLEYAQLLLWGAMNAHQLRQQDILQIEKDLPGWANSASLSIEINSENFLVDLSSDNPPLLANVFSQAHAQANLSLDCHHIIEELSFIDTTIQQSVSPTSYKLTSNLCKHLILAWSSSNDRTFMRLESDDEIDLCIGLNNAHHIISGDLKFDDLIFGNNIIKRNAAKQRAIQLEDHQPDQSNLFNAGAAGSFEVAMENIDFHLPKGEHAKNKRYQNFNVNIVNLSPGGYCLSWDKSSPPTSIRNNELIAIKESHHPAWHLGSIRWVKQQQNDGQVVINMGVELLSPSPQAYGARWVSESGEALSNYFKVLILPEIKTMGQKTSIVLSEPVHQNTNYVVIERDGEEQILQVQQCLQNYASFQQYSFVNYETLAGPPTSGSMGGSGKNSVKNKAIEFSIN